MLFTCINNYMNVTTTMCIKQLMNIFVMATFMFPGYEGLSTLPNVAYRTESFPGIGFLLKRTFYDTHMKDKMVDCCYTR